MPIELQLLVWSAGLAVLQLIIAIPASIAQVGLPTLAGNREGLGEITGLAGRAIRAHRNMLESLVIFAILVLVASTAGRFNAMTVIGAQLFFWGRVAFAVVYLAGIPWVRTLTWAVSMTGLGLIFLQLI
ncbi:MAG: MAPEG family protein [Alphaproteobacteria bacterium]